MASDVVVTSSSPALGVVSVPLFSSSSLTRLSAPASPLVSAVTTSSDGDGLTLPQPQSVQTNPPPVKS